MTPSTERRERPPTQPSVHIGYSLFVHPQLTSTKSEHDAHWKSLLAEVKRNAPIGTPSHYEVQYEQPYHTGFWRELVEPVRSLTRSDVTIGLHSPSINPTMHDLGNVDQDMRSRAVAETVEALQFARASGCNDYVLHLTPFDDFGGHAARTAQFDRAMNSLRMVADAVGGDPGVRVLIENLEYPKWPATTDETVAIMSMIRDEKLFADSGVCLDFAHLWHNIVSLLPQVEDRTQFLRDAAQFVRVVSDVSPIYRIHLAGAFINYAGDDHQTHAVPGKNPLNPTDHVQYFDGAPDGFHGLWMRVDDTLRATAEIMNPARDLSFVIEAHSPEPGELQANAAAIQNRLEQIKK